MINLKDIVSLTEFQRNAKEHVNKIKETRSPYVLTVNGKAELVIQDAESYQKLLDRIDDAETESRIRKALDQAHRGEMMPFDQAFAEFRQKHGL